jgi:hypothetical protein
MAHAYRQAVLVDLTRTGQPWRFRWRGRAYHIEAVIGTWHLRDRWWEQAPPKGPDALTVRAHSNREYFRVQCPGWQVMELYHDLAADIWVLDRVLD